MCTRAEWAITYLHLVDKKKYPYFLSRCCVRSDCLLWVVYLPVSLCVCILYHFVRLLAAMPCQCYSILNSDTKWARHSLFPCGDRTKTGSTISAVKRFSNFKTLKHCAGTEIVCMRNDLWRSSSKSSKVLGRKFNFLYTLCVQCTHFTRELGWMVRHRHGTVRRSRPIYWCIVENFDVNMHLFVGSLVRFTECRRLRHVWGTPPPFTPALNYTHLTYNIVIIITSPTIPLWINYLIVDHFPDPWKHYENG